MTIEYLSFIRFMGRLLLDPSASSSKSSFMASSFLIQMDKGFFKNWVLHIPHRLRDLLWMVRAWSSIAPIFFFSSYESSFFFFPDSTESNHFLLAHIPRINESHDPGRPFKVAITTSAFFTSSFTASSCSWFERPLWLHGLCILDLHILQLDSLGHILIFVLPFK